MILISEIKNIIDGLLNYIQNDCGENPEEFTFLYLLLNGARDGDFDFYQQAKKIFLRNNNTPKKLEVRMEYPKDRTHLPCIVIREPSRNNDSNVLGGIGEQEFSLTQECNNREKFVDFIHSKVDIMCISDNTLESILIGEVIYSLLVGARNSFENMYNNFSFSMGELIAENNLFPTPILIKNISIDVSTDIYIPSIIPSEIVKKFIMEKPTAISNEK